MKYSPAKSLLLATALALSSVATSQADSSIYFPATGAAPYPTAFNSGNYDGYYYGNQNNATRSIGNSTTTGTAFVDVSWGQFNGHIGAATYEIRPNGVTPTTPFAVDERLMANNAAPAGPNWSGFGKSQTVNNYTPGATLNLFDAQTTSVARVSMLTGQLFSATPQNSFLAGNVGAAGATPTGTGYRFGNDEFYYYTPGLSGTFGLDVSWGVFGSNSNNTGWLLDADGTGTNLVSLVSGINQSQFSNGATPAGDASSLPMWSGFLDVGDVTLNPSSRIAFRNLNPAGGTVSDIQLTAVPEPSTYAMFAVAVAFVLIVIRRRRTA